MKPLNNTAFIIPIWVILACICNVHAQLRPAQIFTDHMVLQRDIDIPVWGFAEPGEAISVLIKANLVKTTADKHGKWSLKIPSMEAGGPYKMNIRSTSETIVLYDVMIGEVWFASGQSNMEHALGGWPWIPYSQITNYENEIKDLDFPKIRMFNVPKLASPVEMDDLELGSWELPTVNTLPKFSATAWFFAKELQKRLNIPIGIIHSSWGGTAIAPWMDRESLQSFDHIIPQTPLPPHFGQKSWRSKMNAEWSKHIARRNQISYSELEKAKVFSSSDQSGLSWKSITQITESGDSLKNWIWLKKVIVLPNITDNVDWRITLGYLNRQAHIYINGIEIGYTLYPKKSELEFSSKVLRVGENVVLIRLAQPWGVPQVEGTRFFLKSSDSTSKINLLNNWWVLNPEESVLPPGETNAERPTYLFNGMVAPLLPYTIRGFIWNQGSSDMGRPDFYKKAFPALINGWRKRWEQPDAPFLFVQLSNYQPHWEQDRQSVARAPLRLAQMEALSLPNTTMVVSYDIGDPFDVHPANKQDYGYRLALQALSKVYGKDIESDGPRYVSHEIVGDTVIIHLNTESGQLTSKPMDNPCGFELAGTDGKFMAAKAVIHNHKIYLTSEKVVNPVKARYAWNDNPVCFIYGPEGLPMAPFLIEH
ncbi:sialate O-acetylesterase [Spongiimicrobium sp. 3-5]|uniref:sialate O-acetylesterase n=1 Tax=Spongiimicrobium sp. 3-5 TaxID=3332596 RepID=UPI003980592F